MDLARRAAGSGANTAVALVGSAAVSAAAPALLQLPSSSIVAAQPYTTLSGYGLSVNFAPQYVVQQSHDGGVGASPSAAPVALRALHSLPFSNALVPSAYQHVAFGALLDFCTTERPDTKRVPMGDVWDKLGDIGTCYASLGHGGGGGRGAVESPMLRRLRILKGRADSASGEKGGAGEAAEVSVRPSSHVPAAHPTLAGIELVSSAKGAAAASSGSDRHAATAALKFLDIKVSLYDAQHKPIYTALMTGRGPMSEAENGGGEEDGADTSSPSTRNSDDRSHVMRRDYSYFSSPSSACSSASIVGEDTYYPNNAGAQQQRPPSIASLLANGGRSSGWFLEGSLVVRSGAHLSTFVEIGTPSVSVGGGAGDDAQQPTILFDSASLLPGGAPSQSKAPRRFISQLAFVPSAALSESLGGSAVEAAGAVGGPIPIPPWFLGAMVTEFAEGIVRAQQESLGAFVNASSSSSSKEGASLPMSSPMLLQAADAAASLLFSRAVVSRAAAIGAKRAKSGGILGGSVYDHFASPPLTLASQNSSLLSDVLSDAPIEFVASLPRYFPAYHIPPWQHRPGLPQLRGEECVSIYVEAWQGGERRMHGNFFFTV